MTMRKTIPLLFAVALIILLAACSAAAPTSTSSEAANQTAAAPVEGTPGLFGEVPTLTRLLIGTVRLDETAYAVTPEQARSFIPLWQAVVSLSSSDTTASAEMTALEKQIERTFTSEQTGAMDAMQISRADLQSAGEALGITFGAGDRSDSNGTPSAPRGDASGGGFVIGGGAPPEGGFVPGGGLGPGGAGGFGGPQNLTTEQLATMEARRASRPSLDVPTPLIEALIRWLEARAP
jgi:hypothetical protein